MVKYKCPDLVMIQCFVKLSTDHHSGGSLPVKNSHVYIYAVKHVDLQACTTQVALGEGWSNGFCFNKQGSIPLRCGHAHFI